MMDSIQHGNLQGRQAPPSASWDLGRDPLTRLSRTAPGISPDQAAYRPSLVDRDTHGSVGGFCLRAEAAMC